MISKSRKPPERHVALAFSTRVAQMPMIYKGIAGYAAKNANWIFTTDDESVDLPIGFLRKWKGDGVIAVLLSKADAAAARGLKIPVVTFVGVVRKPGVPRVMLDQAAIGRLAAEHLLSRGFRQFAFYGVEDAAYSADREAAFAERLAVGGFAVSRHCLPSLHRQHPWDDEVESLRLWLERLPSPIGLFAASDARARKVADACRLIGRNVPEEVGIIGVDNNEIACEFGSPKITSISCDWVTVGFEAARLLDHLMRGRKPPDRDKLIPPNGIVARESTNVMIFNNSAVARAAAYAREHIGEPFGVEALIDCAAVSRRLLETSFIKSLGMTPSVYIARLRVEKAKSLLHQRKLTFSRIAAQCGFSDLRHFRRVFARTEKMTPRQYRKACFAAQEKVDSHALHPASPMFDGSVPRPLPDPRPSAPQPLIVPSPNGKPATSRRSSS